MPYLSMEAAMAWSDDDSHNLRRVADRMDPQPRPYRSGPPLPRWVVPTVLVSLLLLAYVPGLLMAVLRPFDLAIEWLFGLP